MSEDDSLAIDENNPEENSIKFKDNFIIKLTNQNRIDRNTKQTCKILQIPSKLDIVQKLEIISTLEPSEYPNLFIFIIEEQNLNFLNENEDEKAKQIVEALNKFSAARPLIIQQISEDENKTKFYYKSENSNEIVDIDKHYAEDYELYEKWQNIFNDLDGRELQSFEDEMLKKLSYIDDFFITLRFSRTLNMQESAFEILVKIVAMTGSKADLLAVLDASFEENGRILNDQAQNYIKNVFEDDESDSEADEEESTSEKASIKDQNNPIDGTSTKNEDSSQSVLLAAIQHSKHEIIDYLVTYWTPLIQQLPVEHQIRISTVAFDTNQLVVLCDLLEFSDFPFPEKFSVQEYQVSHERLQKIITDRVKFHELIEQDDEKEIKDFIENNLSLKFIYSPQNITAMKKAINLQKYKIYYYLKSFGLCASEFRNLEDVLDKKELSKANDQANVQKTESISDALRNAIKSVLILCTRSLIHNRKVKKEDEIKYRKDIKKWLEDINKIAQIMLDIAASCENLVIIFDFESKYVDRTAFRDNAMGLSSDTVSSRIFIGSKLGDSKRDQEIKGVLAHELCHYVMSLVFDNKFLPYYKYATDIRDKFDEIVKSIDKWSNNDQEPPNDECNGIISTVFTSYNENCFHYELIVRAVQILVLYNDQPEQSVHHQKKYQNLFDFWDNHVIPELYKYLQKNKVVIRINATVELLSSLSKSKIGFKVSKDMEQLTKNRIIIAATNVSKLLLINIHKHLQEYHGSLLESQNVFIEPEKVKNAQVWKDLMHIYTKDVKLNIFVDCTKEKLDNLSSILNIEDFKFILVASNEEQSTKLNDICIKKKIKPSVVDIKYNWSDLTENSQKMLIQSKITFQNNSKISIMDLLSKNMNPEKNEVEKILDDFSNIINDQVFNLIMDKQEISVNSNVVDLNKKNFEILFRNRNFLKKGISFKNEISQEKLISITGNNKYVLISDIAGSGKSWVVKNISKVIVEQDPTRWVTYVDLKQFIQAFEGHLKDFEFANYFVVKILKPKTKFEEEIFKELYKNGKVSIIFDAFDEIAPDCAEFVANLAKSFEFNDGNQLWIVTRDYFEVNLQQKLKINNVYKLNEFSEKDGINFIVASWIMLDSKDQTINNFENHLQTSPNLTKYEEKATRIVQTVTMSKNQSIGLPQLFSMIADGFKDDKYVLDDLKGAKIFTKFVQTMYTRWLKKGQIREDANALSLDYELNFKEFHQYCAISSLFPEIIDSLFPDYDKSEWPEVEIIAGGIMNKIGSFNHETFREYFVADFIFKAIKKPKIKKEIIEILIKILTIQKYGIVRMFLNDFMDNDSIMEKVQLELEKFVEIFQKMENLSEYFTENQEHLAKCVIQILGKGNYENVTKILSENIEAILTRTKDLKIFSTFTEFLFSFVRLDDLKDMINSQNIIHKIIGSDSDVENFEQVMQKLQEKASLEFVQQQLKLMSSGQKNGNIFYHLGSSQNLNENKVQKCIEIFQKYLNESEIVELMDKCTKGKHPILFVLVENTMNFKPFFEGAKCIFTNQNLFQNLKNFVNKTDLNDQNILHWSSDKGIDFHTSLWNLIQKTFENQDELKTFLNQKSKKGNNFLHVLVKNNNSETIEFILKKIKENLNESDYYEILRSKGQYGRNLLQFAAANSNEVKTHQILWAAFRDSCESDEDFIEILNEVDNTDSDVFFIAAACSTSDVFEFMEEELTKFVEHDKIGKLFLNLGHANKNILQSVKQNKSLEFHKTLWKIIRKYFNSSQILEFITHGDNYGENLLINVIEYNTKEVIELIWKEVKELLNNNDFITEECKKNVEKCEKIIKTISGFDQLEKDYKEILKLKWIKNKKEEDSKLFNEVIQASVEQNLNINKFENLEFFISEENFKYHEKLWENLVKIYTNRADLKKFLSEKNRRDNNFIHLLFTHNTTDVIEFTLKKYKENLSESDYQEMLRSRGQFERNLIQVAAIYTKEVKIHQILWQELQESLKSDEEFMEVLYEVDENRSNVFNIAASFTTSEIFSFMVEKLEKIATRDEIKKIFIKLGCGNRNLLQSATAQNESVELNEIIWKILRNYFNSSEILEFIKHPDLNGENLLINATESNTKEILELAWTEVEKVIADLYTETETVQKIKECEKIIQKIINNNEGISDEEEELLKLDWIENSSSRSSALYEEFIQDILKNNLNIQTLEDLIPMVNNKNVSNHEILWKHLLYKFENRQDLTKLLFEKDKKGDNFIHHLLIFNTADVIEFTLKKIKENLNESEYKEILRSKGESARNLLQLAAVNTNEVKTHQIVWKELLDSCKSNEEFLQILGEVDEEADNILNFTATCSTGEILKFIQEELEKIDLHEDVKKLLTYLGYARQNLLQKAVIQNKSLELHEVLWEIAEKYFNSSEILQFIKHRDVFGENLVLNLVERNTKEVKELTWNKVRKTLITFGYEDNDNFKKCDEIMKKALNFEKLTKKEKEIFKLDWIENSNSIKLFEDSIQLFIQKQISNISLIDLKSFIADENVKNHAIIWKYLEETFKTYEDLNKLLFEDDKNGNKFIHLLVMLNTADVIQFTIQKLKENLNESDYREMLRSKGKLGRNLLHLAALAVKNVETNEILWKAFQDICESGEEFLKILTEIDEKGNDVINVAASFKNRDVFEFMIADIKKITKDEEIKTIISSFGN